MKTLRPLPIALTVIYIFLLSLLASTAYLLPEKYVYLTQKGLVGEKMQLIFLSVTLLLSLRLGLSRSCRYWPSFLMLVMVFLVALSGYVPWGQELFGLDIAEPYHQKRVYPAGKMAQMLFKPGDSWKIAMGVFWVLYGFVYPLALKAGERTAVLMNRNRIPPPPLCLWPFYVSAALVGQQIFDFNDIEVSGVFLSFALASTVLAHVIQHINSIEPTWGLPRSTIV